MDKLFHHDVINLQYDGLNGMEIGRMLQSANCQIKKLSLCCEEASPCTLGKILAGLADNRSVRKLIISYNQANDYVAGVLANVLLKNHTLRVVDFSFNNIGNHGAFYLANALWSNRSLKKLLLHNNLIGDEGITALLRSLWENNTLQFLEMSRKNNDLDSYSALSDIINYLMEEKTYRNQKITVWLRNPLF